MSGDAYAFESQEGTSPSRPGLQKLHFTQRLIPVPGSKAITTGELVNRLKKLHNDLKQLEQNEVDTDSLGLVRKELQSSTLTGHKDKAVRALTACCLADILRLFAPDAPYNKQQLRGIFEFFGKQLANVGNKDSPYFSYYNFLLDSLSTVRSIILLNDLDAEELIKDYFRNFFDIVKPEFPKDVYNYIVDILQQLVEEIPQLPQELVDIILTAFQKKKENPAAFKLAADLCNSCPTKLQRYVCQYFSDVVVSAAQGFEDHTDENEFEEAHQLILEIYRAAPDVLLSVIPQLEEELKIDDQRVRIIALNTLGDMFSDPGSKLALAYPSVWKSWLGRRVDKLPAVRLEWIENCYPFFVNHPELSREVESGLAEKFMDPDDKVRASAVSVIGRLDSMSARHVSKATLQATGARLRDRKSHVREAASESLSHLYNVKYAEIADVGLGELDAVAKYGWIPGDILDMLYMDDLETRVFVEIALHDQILPTIVSDEARTIRLLNVVSNLTEKQHKAFVAVLDRQVKMVHATGVFLEQCEKYNGGIIDTEADEKVIEWTLNKIMGYLASRFPDQKKAHAAFQKFAKINDNRVYKLLRQAIDPLADYKSIIKYVKEIIKRLGQHAGLMDTFGIYLRRICLTLVPKSSIPFLLKTVQTNREFNEVAQRHATAAEQLLKDLSALFPAFFKTDIAKVVELLTSEDLDLTADALKTLARFARTFPEDIEVTQDLEARLVGFAQGSDPRHAKPAVVVLAQLPNAEDLCSAVHEKIVEGLHVDNESLVAHLAALAALFQVGMIQNDEHITIITNFIVRNILLSNQEETEVSEQDWKDVSQLGWKGNAKILGLKVLTRRVLAAEDHAQAEIAAPVLKLFRRIFETEGELVKDKTTPPATQTHLRLNAALCFLKLARRPKIAQSVSVTSLYKLALTMQDPIFQVRNAFVDKLVSYLSAKSLPFNYLSILLLAAHEPETDLKVKVKNFLTRRSRPQSGSAASPLLESQLPQFIHMLSHHPDYSEDGEDLLLCLTYLDFFLDITGNAENASYLYYIATKLKTVRDIYADDSRNLYVLSDLTQLAIQEKALQNGWSIPSYTGNVHLSKELFSRLPSQAGSENARKSYLSTAFVASRTKSVSSHVPKKVAKKAVVKKEAPARSPSPTGDESDTSITSSSRRKSAVKVPQTPTRSAKKRTRSGKGTPKHSGASSPRTPTSDSTPQRKNAPRAAKQQDRSFRDMSDQEIENDDPMEEGSDHEIRRSRRRVV
ncbi:armadillo-type protein [Phlyctochytrium arcticum]|nr:armadillo-type protein [Phlyctochytrium arcticum]